MAEPGHGKPWGQFRRVGARGVEFWAELPTATWTLTDPKVDPSDHPKAIRVTTKYFSA